MNKQQVAMVIEDEEPLRELICYHLDKRKILTMAYESVEKALPYIEKADVILLNLRLPGMSGADFIKKLRESGNYIPVIIISGCTMPEDLKQYDLIDYVPKGTNINIFWGQIDKALGVAKEFNLIEESTIRLKNFCARQSGIHKGVNKCL